MKSIYIFDFDGTLTNGEKLPMDWTPNDSIVDLAIMLGENGGEIWVWTHRSEKDEREVLLFLIEHAIPAIEIKMRPVWDNSDAVILKERFIEETANHERDNIVFVVDDDEDCCKMYNDKGFQVLNVWNK